MEIWQLSTYWIPHFDDNNADKECDVDDSDDRNDGNVGGGNDNGGNDDDDDN